MNPLNMGGMNPANAAALGGMPMMNNGTNGVRVRPAGEHEEGANYEARLNTYIYGYHMDKGQWDVARALKNSGLQFQPPLVHSEGDANGTDDTKDGIKSQRPDDLPEVKMSLDEQGGSFLLSWFSVFWDIYFAQRKNPMASRNAEQYIQQQQQQGRMANEYRQRMLQGMPGGMPGGAENYQQMMRLQNMNGDLRQKALHNNRTGFQATPQQMQQFARNQHMAQQNMMHQQMRRDPSDMTMNGQRPRTPSAGDHAPSPSKRQRLEGIPFNGQQMMPNGRGPPQGLPVQQMMSDPQAQHAGQLLISNGINPGNLSESQFASFQQQNAAVQAKSIQVYAQNLAKNQRDGMSKAGGMSDQGSPMMAPGMDLGVGGPDFYAGANPAAAMQMRNGGVPPHGAANGAAGNHALQDYQMQLMLLEQQNKKRLLMARQEQDTITRPDGQPGMPGPAGFAPGMSPQGSRGGTSPGPGEQGRRGTPKMGQPGLPGSPLPDGSIRGSPAAMNFNSMNPDMYGQMNGGPMRPPPSSHPGFNGQFNPQQQMEAMQRAAQAGGRMPNGTWPQGPQGQAPMMQQPQPQQPAQMGTPQQRNDMPPPQGLPAGAIANGRPGSPAAPPTPQPANKANPKSKKDTKDRKKPTKKNSAASVAQTPASEVENPPATPTPSTPITPSHPNSFAAKSDAQGQASAMQSAAPAPPPQLAPPQPDTNATAQFNLDGNDGEYSMPFNSDLTDPNLLENFDFEQFLQNDAFSFDAAQFDTGDGIETGIGDA